MSSENTAFYARLKKVQELQHKRERKRLDLQRHFENYAMSDHNISRLRAAKLQTYWKKICENERKSKARNEQLLRDFDRVEAHIATLSSRTERLRLLKDQYERQVESMFPYWKEQMEIKRMSQTQQTQNVSQPIMMSSQQNIEQAIHSADIPSSTMAGGTPLSSAAIFAHYSSTQIGDNSQQNSKTFPQSHQHSQHGIQKPNSVPEVMTKPITHPIAESQHHSQVFADGYEVPMVPGHSGAPTLHAQPAPVSNSQVNGQLPVTDIRKNEPSAAGALGHLPLHGQTEESSSFTVSSESPRSPQHQVRPSDASKNTQPMQWTHAQDQAKSPGTSLSGRNSCSEEKPLVGDEGQQAASRSLNRTSMSSRNQFFTEEVVVKGPAGGGVGGGERLPSAQTDPFSSSDDYGDESKSGIDKALYSPELPPELPKYEEQSGDPSKSGPTHFQESKEAPQTAAMKDATDESSGSEEDSEIDSDVSLPLSEERGRGDGRVPTERKSISSKAPEPVDAKPNAIALTNDGFYLLMKAVEAEIDATDSLEGIYATLACTRTIRDEIVRTANTNSGFDLLDPRAISMVILEELPLLIQKLPGRCLLSERLLVASSRTITELSIRSHMMSSALKLWDDIHSHMVFLVRRGVMEPEGVAMKFAPLLVAPDSEAIEKAIHVISDILMKAEEEEDVTFGDDSSVTDASHRSPVNPTESSPDVIQHPRTQQPEDYPAVPPLAVGGMEGDTDDLVDTGRTSGDSFFDNKVPLNETSAYQRMMMSSQAEMNKTDEGDGDEDEEESDSEDEIEKATRINMESPSSQKPKKKRNVLSSLGGSLGQSVGSDEEGRQPLPSDRTDEVSSADKSDLTSSLSPTPRGGGGGYVPSAMEQSMKSTGRTDTMNRSAAFWGNESDLDDESEMSVPMGTGKVEEEKDDFDFYD